MMSDREVWLKAMAIVEVRSKIYAPNIVDIILEVVGNTADQSDWARVAAAVDAINGTEPQ
jgi:hypothetical protein